MTSYAEAAKLPEQEPDFSRLLSSFRSENSRAIELMQAIHNVSTGLKPLIQPKNERLTELKKEDNSVTGQLWYEIDRMKSCNDSFEEIYRHLREIIGT